MELSVFQMGDEDSPPLQKKSRRNGLLVVENKNSESSQSKSDLFNTSRLTNTIRIAAKNALCKTEGFQRTKTNRRPQIVRDFCDHELDGPQDDEPDPF